MNKKMDQIEYIRNLEIEVQQLRIEKENGFGNGENANQLSIDKEMLGQEIARLNEKIKRTQHQLEDLKKKEADWIVTEGRYSTTCKNFKKTIADLKKEIEQVKAEKKNTTFDSLFTETNKLKKEYEQESKILYELYTECFLENAQLRASKRSRENVAQQMEEISQLYSI